MSYYRSEPLQREYSAGAHTSPSASPLRPTTYFPPSPDGRDTSLSSHNVAHFASGQAAIPSYGGQDYASGQYQQPQAYNSGMRAPRLQFPTNTSNVSSNVSSAVSPYPPSSYGSSVQNTYNPQDYAQSSPQAQSGASYVQQSHSPQAYVLPATSYSPGSYRRYDPALYQNTAANTANRVHGSPSGGPPSSSPGGHNSAIGYPQDGHHALMQTIPSQTYSYPHSQQSQYSPQLPPNEVEYHYSQYPYPAPPASRHFTSSTPPPLPVPQRDSNRDSPRNHQERLPRPEQSAHMSPHRPSTSHESIDVPSHSVFDDPIEYLNYHSPRLNETQANPFPAHNPSSLYESPQYGLARTQTTGRHPQSRPLPGPPPEPDVDDVDDREGVAQQELYEQVEHAIGSYGRDANHSYMHNNMQRSYSLQESYVNPTNPLNQGYSSTLRPNGFRSLTTPTHSADYDQYSDESDAEAAAGIAAMEMAAKEEAQAIRRQRSGDLADHDVVAETESLSDDEDYRTMDISSYGGGFAGHLSYGGTPSELASGFGSVTRYQHRSSSSRTLATVDEDGYLVSNSSRPSAAESPARSTHGASSRTDLAGTGGFSDVNMEGRRMSFVEGDEIDYLDDQAVAGTATADMSGGPPNLPYTSNAPIVAHRPLPPPPPLINPNDRSPYLSPDEAWKGPSWMAIPVNAYPVAPESYSQAANSSSSSLVPRSISLTSPPATPQLRLPDRAKTDAEERKGRVKRTSSYGYENMTLEQGQNLPQIGLDLPTLPMGRRFQPSKLTQKDFDKCNEPWALSAILAWLRSMAEGESELREHAINEALLALFTHKVTNMHIADGELLAADVVKGMLDAGILRREEEWLRFEQGSLTGILPQLSGRGCFALSLHDHDIAGRCYSWSCQRTLKRIDAQEQGVTQAADWATYYKITKEDVEKIDKKEIERQNVLHEIVTTEQEYLEDLNSLRTLYRDGLETANPPIIAPKQLPAFLKDVFGKLDAVQLANEQFLLPQLRYRQKEQGPWIAVISDIFRDWIRKAKAAYIEYAANVPQAYHLLKVEEQRNSMFQKFCENARNNKQSRKLGWDSFLKRPITRLQRYGLFLQTALRNMTTKAEPEMANLQIAIDEIKIVTLECDARVAEQGRKVDLVDLHSKLILRPEMKHVELNITQKGRELLFRGDLQRTGANRFNLLDIHVILLDNYLILTKTITQREGTSGPKSQRYDVSKMPIPMDLLVLESTDDDPVVKSSVKGITSASGASPRSSATVRSNSMQATTLSHVITNGSLNTVDTSSSGRTTIISTTLENGKDRDEKTLHPFRIKHLGKETYTLYAMKAEDRKIWCEKITEAKTKHASSLYRQGAEPFELRILADSAFAYDQWTAGGAKNVLIKGTPLSRAVDEVETVYTTFTKPGPICRARVNCATTFVQPKGKKMMAVGTDYGVYTAEVGNVRGWTRVIPGQKVTQIAVLEEYNLVLVIADKSLIAHHLDVVCPSSGLPNSNNSSRKAPQKLSGSRDVGFFATGRMKDRTLVFYKKKDGLQSTFRILEPILQKATERRSRILHRGTTEFFRDYDDFYVPTECIGLDLFSTSLAVATSKGFEVLNLEKKTPWSVPDLKQNHTASIATRLSGVDPLAMFRLSDAEFLCVYEECAVYIDKHGDVSRGVVLEFVGKAKAAALEAGYLILFDTDFVEIRDAQLGRLKQIIPGRDIRCLDNARNGGLLGRSVKFALQHPENERLQIVMELVLNQGTRG